MSEHGDPPHFIVPLKSLGSRNGQSSCPVPSVPTRKRLSPRGRAMLTRELSIEPCIPFLFLTCPVSTLHIPGTFDGGCHFPTREQKEALLRELQKTDPGYTLQKLSAWFISHRRSFQESRKEQKDGEDNLSTLLDPTTALARESKPPICSVPLRYTL
jgi:hypothetical protein